LLAFVQIRFFPSVIAMVIYAYTMEGGLAPALLAAFYWKRASAAGGFACVLSAGITTVIWEYLGQPYGISTSFVTIGVSIVFLIVVSLLTSRPTEDQLRRFEVSGIER
jgi:Na+/proline symporter